MATTDYTSSAKAIPSAPGYFATADGDIIGKRGKRISQHTGTRGYIVVSIWVGRGQLRRRVSRLQHRLVAEAFLGPCPTGIEVNHKNGVKADNRVKNLEYVTKSQNEQHAHRIGLKSHVGEKNSATCLTEHDVVAIRTMCASGKSQRSVASLFGVSQSAVSLMVNRKNWSHVR